MNAVIRSPDAADWQGVSAVNRACRDEVAQHAPYLIWTLCTLYRNHSLVAVNGLEQIVGYVLSLPGPAADSEFILQVAVLPEWRRTGLGIELLSRHWAILMAAGKRRALASVHEECRRGKALLKLARWRGQRYERVIWPAGLRSDPFGRQEVLYEARILE